MHECIYISIRSLHTLCDICTPHMSDNDDDMITHKSTTQPLSNHKMLVMLFNVTMRQPLCLLILLMICQMLFGDAIDFCSCVTSFKNKSLYQLVYFKNDWILNILSVPNFLLSSFQILLGSLKTTKDLFLAELME